MADDRREITVNELLTKIGMQTVEIDELRRLLDETRRLAWDLQRQLEEARKHRDAETGVGDGRPE